MYRVTSCYETSHERAHNFFIGLMPRPTYLTDLTLEEEMFGFELRESSTALYRPASSMNERTHRFGHS